MGKDEVVGFKYVAFEVPWVIQVGLPVESLLYDNDSGED